MAKGYQANKERQVALAEFGKSIGKRASFKCEWCEGKDDLRLWDYRPDSDPEPETLALLCRRCRDLAAGVKPEQNELKSIRNALWSDIPAIAEGAARVLAQCREPWAREAIEESLIPDEVKAELLK
jgi:protein PhnA